MLAAVFEGVENVALRDVPLPEIGADEILLRVKAATICGTDLKIVSGKKTRGVRMPSVLGHEVAGEIADIGANVRDWNVGSDVTVAPVIACGDCHYCRGEMGNLCAIAAPWATNTMVASPNTLACRRPPSQRAMYSPSQPAFHPRRRR